MGEASHSRRTQEHHGHRSRSVGEAAHPGTKSVSGSRRCPSRVNRARSCSRSIDNLRRQFAGLEDEGAFSSIPGTTQPVVDTLPTWPDSIWVDHLERNVSRRVDGGAVPSTLLDALEEDLLHNNGGSGSSVRQSSIRRLRLVSNNNTNSVDDSAASVLVEPRRGEVSRVFDRVAVPVVLNIEDDLPTTVPATSGQVRALYDEEGRRITPPNSTRQATDVDISSDRERVNTNQFDMTAGDIDQEIDVPGQAHSNVTASAIGYIDFRGDGIGEDVPVVEPLFEADDTESVEWFEVDEDWAETVSIPEDDDVSPV